MAKDGRVRTCLQFCQTREQVVTQKAQARADAEIERITAAKWLTNRPEWTRLLKRTRKTRRLATIEKSKKVISCYSDILIFNKNQIGIITFDRGLNGSICLERKPKLGLELSFYAVMRLLSKFQCISSR